MCACTRFTSLTFSTFLFTVMLARTLSTNTFYHKLIYFCVRYGFQHSIAYPWIPVGSDHVCDLIGVVPHTFHPFQFVGVFLEIASVGPNFVVVAVCVHAIIYRECGS